jgi:O-antigen/teichoic acid export membrane protein
LRARLASVLDRRLLGNIGWLGSASFLVKPFWFVFITAVCMRMLGVDQYGVLTTALALSVFIQSVSDSGTTLHTTREIARQRDGASELLSNVLALRTALAIVATTIVLVFGFVVGYDTTLLLSVGFAALYAYGLSALTLFRGVFQGFERLKSEARSLYLEKALVIGGGSIMLVLTREPHWTLAGMAAGLMITATSQGVIVARSFVSIDPRYLRRAAAISIGRTVLPLALAGVFVALYQRVDIIMLQRMVGDAAAGTYGAAYRIFETLSIIPAVVVLAAMLPRFSRLVGEGRLLEVRRLAVLGSLVLFVGGIAVAGAFYLFGDVVIHLLDPRPEFIPAGNILGVLAWTFPFYCVSTIFFSVLIALRRDVAVAVCLGIVVVVNIGLNSVLIPLYGAIGAAAATVVVEVVLLACYLVPAARKLL